MRSFFLARREYCLPPRKSSTLGFLLYLGFGQATYSSKSAFIPHPPFNDAPSRDDMAAEWCAQSGKIGCGTSERALPSSFEALLKLKRDHQERRISDEILNAMLDKHYEDFQQCVSEWGGRNTSDSATRSARDEAKCTRDSERMLGAVCTIIRYFDLADPLLLQALYNRLADRTLITPRLSPSMLSLCMRCVVELGVIRNDAYAVLRETSLSLENTVLRKCQDLRVVVNIIYAIAVLENAQGTPYVYRDTARDLTPLFLRVEQLLRNIRFPHPKHLRKIAIAMRCSTYCRPQLVTLLHNCTMDVYNRSHKRKRIENTGRCLSTEDLHIILGAMMSLGGPTEELQKALCNSAVNQHGLILMSEKTLK